MNEDFLRKLGQAQQTVPDAQPPTARPDATRAREGTALPVERKGMTFQDIGFAALRNLVAPPMPESPDHVNYTGGGPGLLAQVERGPSGGRTMLSLLESAVGDSQQHLASAARQAQRGFDQVKAAYTGSDNLKELASRIVKMGGADTPSDAVKIAKRMQKNTRETVPAALSDDQFFKHIEEGKETRASGMFTRYGVEREPTAAVNLEKTKTPTSTAQHEMSHAATVPGVLQRGASDPSYNAAEVEKTINEFFPNRSSGNVVDGRNYLDKTSEVQARLNELRFAVDPNNPWRRFGANEVAEAYNKLAIDNNRKDIGLMLKNVKGEEDGERITNLTNLLNKMFGVTAATGAVTQAAQDPNNNPLGFLRSTDR